LIVTFILENILRKCWEKE